MNEETKQLNLGYIEDKIYPLDFVFGDAQVPDDILQPDGQWDAFLPVPEDQLKNGIETANCTGFATDHVLQTLMKRKFGGEYDFSDRYTGITAGTFPPGNSPMTVIEKIRKESGVINESLLPFSPDFQTVDDYYKPNPMLATLIAQGKDWLSQYRVRHDWVLDGQDAMMEALKHSPLGAAVYAWELGPDGLYIRPPGAGDIHWVEIHGFVEDVYWKVFDQYSPYEKRLEWNFGFTRVKRYYVEQIALPAPEIVEPHLTWWQKLMRKLNIK